ncbi:hypothetical protein [Deinococcus soli (ex Cha et al. 2016)]|uniref:Uncharacterized protein n=1 Tax=Deinococcus soli (ex Cha et al. 2016) TaxID=1309411 RepID=A0ACC6KNK6_9DEIO|nr:hypothetical protein [Deinococcus soli (ex Cha et al. 2016)]MDR6330633.1 hypothetical protein [Deinococcus soli (ex Cha et al. 2016)]MDR6754000.1 hypothetical protein [Deinococcus soli (ex Cha et al. 2016)]
MSHQNTDVVSLRYGLREAAKSSPLLRGESPDRLTALTLAMRGTKRFYEGFYGQRFKEQLRKGAELRLDNPKAYEAALERHAEHTRDFPGLQKQVRALETITSSDLTYAIGATRELERLDPLPSFATDLFLLVRRRTRPDLSPITAGGGVNLAHRFLNIRPEGTTHTRNSWVGRGTTYSLLNLEDGFDLTWEAVLNNKLGEYEDALFELGQNGARTRAWLILDAIRRGGTFLDLPDANLGPNISNLEAADAYLGEQQIDGRVHSANLTDVFVPGTYRAVARRALTSPTVQIVGGANGAATQMPNDNPIYQKGDLHSEAIITEAPIDAADVARGMSNRDWIVADRSLQPVEFATLAGFETGPRLLTKIPEIVELDNMGSFGEHIISTKVSDVAAAEVRAKEGVILVRGQRN